MTRIETWLVAGLGNPGPGYAGHRHNVGQMALAVLADRLGATFKTPQDELGGRRGADRARRREARARQAEHVT